MIRLTTEPINYAALTEQVRRNDCGAVALFLGTVRELTAERQTLALDYEAYPAMAEKKMAEIEGETRERWPVGEMAMVHRLGWAARSARSHPTCGEEAPMSISLSSVNVTDIGANAMSRSPSYVTMRFTLALRPDGHV